MRPLNGTSYRTDSTGLRELRRLLTPLEVEVVAFDLPAGQGAEACLHLQSLVSLVDHDLAVVHSPLMPASFRQMLKERGYQFVECPREEYDSLGCNVLAVAPRVALIPKRLTSKDAFYIDVILNGRPGTVMDVVWDYDEVEAATMLEFLKSEPSVEAMQWTVEQAAATVEILTDPADLPDEPIHSGNIDNMFLVTEREARGVAVIAPCSSVCCLC